MFTFDLFYLAIKIFLLASFVRSLVIFDPLRKHWLFLAFLYTGLIAGVCWVFFNWKPGFSQPVFQQWAVLTLVCSAIYFGLLTRLADAGILFWLVMIAGMAFLVWY